MTIHCNVLDFVGRAFRECQGKVGNIKRVLIRIILKRKGKEKNDDDKIEEALEGEGQVEIAINGLIEDKIININELTFQSRQQ